MTLDNFQVHSPERLIERVVGRDHLPSGVVLGRVLPALRQGGVIVIAGHIRNIGGAKLQSFKMMQMLLMGIAAAVLFKPLYPRIFAPFMKPKFVPP